MGADTLTVRFIDDERGRVIPFRPHASTAIEIKNIVLIPSDADTIDDRNQFAMDDDNAPCELNPDPFIEDI